MKKVKLKNEACISQTEDRDYEKFITLLEQQDDPTKWLIEQLDSYKKE